MVMIRAAVTVFASHKDVPIHATVILSVFQISAMPTITAGMVLVPHHPCQGGKEETTHTTGRGEDLTDVNKSSMMHCNYAEGCVRKTFTP